VPVKTTTSHTPWKHSMLFRGPNLLLVEALEAAVQGPGSRPVFQVTSTCWWVSCCLQCLAGGLVAYLQGNTCCHLLDAVASWPCCVHQCTAKDQLATASSWTLHNTQQLVGEFNHAIGLDVVRPRSACPRPVVACHVTVNVGNTSRKRCMAIQAHLPLCWYNDVAGGWQLHWASS